MKKLYTLICACALYGVSSAQTVVQENFDTGIPGTWVVDDFLNDNLTWFGTTGGYGGGGTNFLDGTEFIMVDSDADGNGTEMVEDVTSPAFDGTPYAALTLEFDHYYRNLNSLDTGRVEVWDGTAWQVVATFVGSNFGAWNAPDQQSIDITPHINPAMQVRFHYDDNNSWAWYWAIDNYHVYAPAANDVGVVAAVGPLSSGRAGTSNALTAAETIEVTIENFGGSPASNIPVYYSINGVPTGPEMVAGPIAGGTTMNYVFTATADLSALGNYDISAWTMFAGDAATGNDTLPTYTIRQVGNPALILPFCADFESATPGTVTGITSSIGAFGLDYLDLTSSNTLGRFRTNAGAGYAHTGTQALTLDMNPSGTVTINYADLVLNLTGYDVATDVVLLDMWFMEHGDEVQTNDMIWVRGSDLDPWIVISDWNAVSGGANGVYHSVIDFDLGAALSGGGQVYSASTTIRVGQEDNFPSTSLTASDGLTIDDFCLRVLNPDDAQPVALISPSNNACGDSMSVVCATIQSLGTDTLFTADVTLNWTNDMGGSGTQTVTYSDTILTNGMDTVCFAPLNTWDGGYYSFEIITDLLNDLDPSNDTLFVDSVFIAGLHTPMLDTVWACATGDTICLTDMMLDTTLTYQWFASDTATTPIFTGSTFCVDSMFNDTAFYVQSSGGVSEYIGALDTTIGGVGTYSNYPDGLRFNAFEDIVIEELKVYPEGAGDIVVRILDNTMTPVATATVTVNPSVAFEPTYIALNLQVPAGTGYYIDAVGTTVTQMLRNSGGGAYPYTGASVEIYEAINQLGGYYYFWYDWKVSTTGCSGPRVCVPIMIDTDSVVAGFTSSATFLDASFTDASTNGTGGWWDFGDGTTDTVNQNPNHTYAAEGTYQVCQYVWNNCTTDSICFDITVCAPVAADFTSAMGAGDFTFDFTDASTGTVTSWAWDFGDSNTSTTQNPTHTYAGEGTFTVTLTVMNACGDSSTTSEVITVTGLEDSFSNASVSIFPNPSNGQFNLNVEADFIESLTVELFDVNGKRIYNKALKGISGNAQHVIDITPFADGIYIIHLTVGDKQIIRRLIKG